MTASTHHSSLITHHSYAIDGVMPRRVERPDTPEAVAAHLKSAAEARQAVVPWGTGTKQGMGNAPRAYDLALDLTALDQVVEYEPADLVVIVQAGTRLDALQRRLAAAGQFLALDPPYAERATLGGTLATNMSGPSRLLYGTARDLVLGMRVASPGGDLVKSGGKVVKNVVGYDLNKMHIGGLGTLGVMVEFTLKVHPRPRAEATVVAGFESLSAAHAAAGRLSRSVLYLRAVELVRASLPGLPDDSGWRVLAWAAGSPATVERQVRDATAWCAEGRAVHTLRLDGEAHAAAWRAVREFGRDITGEATLLKLTCLPMQVANLAECVDRFASEARDAGTAGTAPEMVAHAGNGVLYALLTGATPALLQRLTGVAVQGGGSAVVERAPAAIRQQLDVWGPTRGDFRLMQALKAEFDPHAALNPGRFVGGI